MARPALFAAGTRFAAEAHPHPGCSARSSLGCPAPPSPSIRCPSVTRRSAGRTSPASRPVWTNALPAALRSGAPPSVTRRATGTPAHLFPARPGHTPPAPHLRLAKRPGRPARSRRQSSALRHRLCGRAHAPARLHGTALRPPPSFRPAFAAVAPSQRTRTARDGTSRRPYHASETPGRARALSRTLEKGAPSWPTPHWSPERQAASGKPSAFCSPATATIWSP